MGTPAKAVAPPQQGRPALSPTAVKQSALVPSPQPVPDRGSIDPDSAIARLPVELEVGLPVREFRVRNLLALNLGVVVASQWNYGEDLPLAAGDVQLAWTQFEVMDNVLAARITRLA